MSYLMPYQYYPLIGEIFGGDRETIKEFLLFKYKDYKDSNPRFVQFIRDCIIEIFSVVEPQNLEYKNQWLINNPEAELDEAPDRTSFFFDSDYLKRTFTLNEYKNLIDGFNEFVSSSKELEQVDKIKNLEETPLNDIPKLKWTGTPGEFGTIFKTLIDNGFIEKVKDIKNTVRILSRIFAIKNDKEDVVNFEYLYKCFGEKKKEYYPNEFKIPLSDNEGKKK